MNQIAQKRYFQSKKEKNENDHQILHIQISLGSKFQFQQIILILWNKFSEKSILPVENRKNDESIEFFIFELV